MLKKSLALILSVIMLFGSITCGFTASAEEANMVITPTAVTSLSKATTPESRLSSWTRNSGGSAAVSTENGEAVVSRTGYKAGQLFTNTFTLEKNNTYRFSFEVKIGEGVELTNTSSGVVSPRGIDFVLQEFGTYYKDGTQIYNMYREGYSDYAHTSKNRYPGYTDNNKLRSGFSYTWTVESNTDTPYTYSANRFSSFGRKFGTSESPIEELATVDLEDFYADWRTFTCEFVLPDDDEYTASDIAIGFILPGDATELYVKNVTMSKVVLEDSNDTIIGDDVDMDTGLDDEPIDEIPIEVLDTEGNKHPSADDISASTSAVYNDDDTVTVSIDYDDMDTINVFKGWYEGDEFLSADTTYTLGADVNERNVKAVMLSRSVITGGLGFESYTSATSLRVDPKQSGTPPYDDKWGIWSNFYKDASVSTEVGYENIDWDFDIKTAYGDTTVSYAPEYDTDAGSFVTSTTTIKPYSGNSMFYFAARSRSIVRKLDNLEPNTNYELSFYTYNLTNWDFLSSAVVADTYDMKTGNTSSTDTVKVYGFYKETFETSTVVSNRVEISDTSKVLNWQKISVNFSTDEDDTELYLHLECKTGNSSSSTSKQFIDNLTCSETVIGYAGNAIRAKNGAKPQALRYKFFLDNSKVNGFGSMTTAKIGILAVKNEICGTDTLEIGKKYSFNGESRDIIDVEVSPESNFQYVDGDSSKTYFTAALYNIGAKGGRIDYDAFFEDYAVRPYIIYEDENGSQMLIYGDTINANVFNVMYAIVRDNTSEEDVATAKSMLEDKKLADAYYKWQPTDSWYIGESKATNYAYSFAVVGDTQKTTGYYPDKLHYTYDWILDNAESKNIQYVMGLGDITEWIDPKTEWPIAVEQLERLEQAGINQSIVRGNHDGISYFDKYITVDKFGNKLSGSYDNTMKNTYRLITIGSVKYMMLTLNLFPNNNEIAWAEQVLAAYPDYNVILTTHAYFDHDMSLTQDDDIDWVDDVTVANSGQDIYDKLVSKYSNIVLVVCGHRYPPDYGPNYRVTTRADGSKVMEMMINPQKMESDFDRSYGMLAMLYVSEDGRSIQLEYFSTISGMYYKDKFQFEFELDLVD